MLQADGSVRIMAGSQRVERISWPVCKPLTSGSCAHPWIKGLCVSEYSNDPRHEGHASPPPPQESLALLGLEPPESQCFQTKQVAASRVLSSLKATLASRLV